MTTFSSNKVRIAVIGDSNTEADSPKFAAGQIGSNSWVRTTVKNGVLFVGGWAKGGSTSVEQAQNYAGVNDAGVLVIMTGTNDLSRQLPFRHTESSIVKMVDATLGAKVVLLAIPPRNSATSPTVEEFNSSLSALASEHGWTFSDQLQFARSPGGRYVDGLTSDGTHLTPDAEKQLGENVAKMLQSMSTTP